MPNRDRPLRSYLSGYAPNQMFSGTKSPFGLSRLICNKLGRFETCRRSLKMSISQSRVASRAWSGT
jgi:hypothetical protein